MIKIASKSTSKNNWKKAFFMLFVSLAYGLNAQCPPPSGDPSPFFCSQASWANAGTFGIAGDVLGDLDINGENLAWYAQDPSVNPSATVLPPSTTMIDGSIYYVTQSLGGCESPPLTVTVTDRGCGCIKEPDFEEQDDTFTDEGYEFYIQSLAFHKTCGAQIGSAPTIPLGPMDDFSFRAAPVSSGFAPTPDPDLPNNISRVNPANPFSTKGVRLNNDGLARLISMSKEFVAGEVFVFHFSLILEDPDHRYDEQPFFQVRIYDKNNNLIKSKCVVSSPDDCVFNTVGQDFSANVYTDWSCIKLNTRSIQGEAARVEFTVADCTRTGHFGYVYIDDLYVGNEQNAPCDNPAFGYMAVSSAQPADQNCYIIEDPNQGLCSNGLSKSIPYPIQICGDFSPPISTGNPPMLNTLTMDITQNGNVVGTLTSPSIDLGKQTFCFTINEGDISVFPPYGNFKLMAEIDFDLDCGTPYSIEINDRSRFLACPPAGCPAPLEVCDNNGTGIGTFDLTQTSATIRGPFAPADVDLAYYETQADAFNQVGEITTPQNYTNTSPGSQTIYVRLDWHLQSTSAADDCFYLVAVQLFVRDLPVLDIEDKITACGENLNAPIVATPTNLSDLGTITYRWFKDGLPLPYLGNIYYATEAGTYTVTVSNYSCSVTKTIEVEILDFSVDLGDDVVEVCGKAEYTIEAEIIDGGNTPPIDLSQVTYLWSTGATTQNISVSQSGVYTVEATYQGCTVTDSVNLSLAELPEVSLGEDFDKCIDAVAILTAQLSGSSSSTFGYTWYRNGVVIPDEHGSSIEIVLDGTYRVEAGEPGEAFCVGEDEIIVGYYDNEHCVITQGISPNGDGFNQGLDLTFLNDRTGILSVEVFNRYGTSIYKKTGGYTNEWHGQTDNGDMVVTGTYFYVIKLRTVDVVFDKQVLTGWIYVHQQMN